MLFPTTFSSKTRILGALVTSHLGLRNQPNRTTRNLRNLASAPPNLCRFVKRLVTEESGGQFPTRQIFPSCLRLASLCLHPGRSRPLIVNHPPPTHPLFSPLARPPTRRRYALPQAISGSASERRHAASRQRRALKEPDVL